MKELKVKKIRWLAIVGLALIIWLVYWFGGGKMKREANLFKVEDSIYGDSYLDVDSSGLQAKSMPAMANKAEQAVNSVEVKTSNAEATVGQKIIKNGSLTLKVSKTDRAAEKIGQIAKNNGGEVVSSTFYERIKGERNGQMTIEVPVDKFDSVLVEIKKLASQVLNENTSAQDVTAKFVDLEARLKSKKAEEEAFAALLNRANNNKDLLDTTRELARVRKEIEQLEGEKRFMESRTDKSTIKIDLREDVEVTSARDGWRPWEVVKESFKGLINKAQQAIDWMIRFVIEGLPTVIFISIVFFAVYQIGRWGYRKFFAKKEI